MEASQFADFPDFVIRVCFEFRGSRFDIPLWAIRMRGFHRSNRLRQGFGAAGHATPALTAAPPHQSTIAVSPESE
jgi:hypothetical protein